MVLATSRIDNGLHFTVYKRTGRPDSLSGNYYIISEGLTQIEAVLKAMREKLV
jgi:hypothetical protein